MSLPKITPMMQQYLSVKEAYPDTILFYRMGDFYEMFFDDAEVASRVLEITLTSRNKKDETPIPMCGVPHRAASGYISRLLNAGHKVAICDQVEDPATAKGLVKREVVRVITPGMIVENEYLEEKSNNFVLALVRVSDRFGLAYLDLSTGTFRLTESDQAEKISAELLRVSPSEAILPETGRGDPDVAMFLDAMAETSVTWFADRCFESRTSRKALLQQFKTVSLEGFGCEQMEAGVRAAGGLLLYVQDTQKQPVEHIQRVEPYFLERYLWLDDMSCRNLELTANIRSGSRQGTLLSVIDRTVTAMGGRMLKQWLRYPLLDVAEIERRLDAVEEAKNSRSLRNPLREALQSVYDLERLGSKITMGHCNARDLTALKQSLQMLPEIGSLLSRFDAVLFCPQTDPDGLVGLASLIDTAIREDAPLTTQEGGMIKPGYNRELDELVQMSRDGKGWLARLEAQEREATGIQAIKVRYNKVFGYYIEVPKSRAENVPAHYVRKQTLVNAERYITDELKTFEARVLEAEEQRASLELEIFNRIRSEVIRSNADIQQWARFVGRLDCLLALAETADQNSYCRPYLNIEGMIRIEDGRHPVIEKVLIGERFVPNTIVMDNDENQVLIITGPNMAGKSTALRQTAITVLMAHIGSFVPARSATVCPTDRIFTRVGALDNLSGGQSTFLVEMQETANILNNATADSLVILDEIGRGTSTFDGLSIAWAVAEHLHDLNATGVKTLFATHYHELTELAASKARVRNYHIAVKEWNDRIIFLRKLVEGGTNRSYGIQVARLAGVPGQVVRRAKKILARIENDSQHVLLSADRSAGETENENKGVQLDLFHKTTDIFSERLLRADLEKMTPIDALNFLHELRQQAKAAAK
jgi:DNA mismatch repair protein MutS